MVSRYDVRLGGVHMSSLDPDLLILNVEHTPPEFTMQTQTPAGSYSIVTGERKKTQASVVITFELHKYDIAERQEALQSVIAWCRNGGTLVVNDRSTQRLAVICEKMPAIESVRDWTSPLSITFSAYGKPYWEDITETVATLQGTNARGTIAVPGNADYAPFTVEVTPTARAITSLTVGVGSNSIALSGINCPVGTTITFTHSTKGILTIKQGTTSILAKRTAASADDLTAACGASAAISVVASGKVTAAYKVRGWWL